jgi:serine/threonine protein kinase
MNAQDHWQRVRALFAQSLEQPDAARDSWLDSACDDAEVRAEIRRLLAQRGDPASIFGDGAQALLAKIAARDDAVDTLLGSDIGPYRLRRLLGEGGMGRVYLAERTSGDFRQQVALKLIRGEFASNELRQRFLRERNTLARLAHPNIAQLHDGGVAADGTPYFTLEYVAGEPITRWCDAHTCDLRARVRLMLKVCDAVLHAHRNLIVHRDLKPSNILVGADGEPKLLDFGIAKPLADSPAAETLTHADARPMTREYAAPEQLLGDPLTTATDIYALGTLLYLLLSGHMPYRHAEAGEVSWIKAILEQAAEPMERAIERADAGGVARTRATTPAALKRALRGDLERIVQRTLAKRAESRYPTVDKLADDLRAWLDGRAISGGARTYRLRKFVRRHWLPLAAGATLLAVLLASAIGLAWEAGQVERQARTAAAAKDFLVDLFQTANPEIANGKVPTMRDAVDLGVKRLDSIPPEQSELRAELQVTLGMIYNQLGLPKQARDMHHEAVAVLKVHSPDPLLTIRAERFEAVETGGIGDFVTARTLAEDALDRVHRLSHAPVGDLVRTLDTVHYVAIHRADLERQKQVGDEAIRAIEGAQADDEVRAMAWAMEADYLRRAHDDVRAIEYYKRAWPLQISPQTRSAYGLTLGASLQNLGRYEEAADYLRKTWDTTRQAYGESNSRTLRVGQMMVINEIYAGRIRDGEEHIAHLLEASLNPSLQQEDVVAEIRLNYGEVLSIFEQYDRAAEQVAGALAYCAAHPNAEAELCFEAASAMGYIELQGGKLVEAQKRLENGLHAAEVGGLKDTAVTLVRLGQVRALRGDIDAGVQLSQQGRDQIAGGAGEKSPEAVEVHSLHGKTLELARRLPEAQAEYRAAIAAQTALLPPDGMHFFSADARLALGRLLAQDTPAREEARHLIEQAAMLRAQTLGADHPRTLAAKQQLENLLAAH